jgi:hypothetical protein
MAFFRLGPLYGNRTVNYSLIRNLESEFYFGTLRVTEMGENREQGIGNSPSGVKTHGDLIWLMPGMNPRPTARMSFSAAVKPGKSGGSDGTGNAMRFQNMESPAQCGVSKQQIADISQTAY